MNDITAHNIRLIREQLGESRKVFATRFGVVVGTIQAYEEGRAKPKAQITDKLCKLFNLQAGQLFDEHLTPEDLKRVNGTPSPFEAKLQAARQEIDALKQVIKDKEYIIELQKQLLKK